MKKANIITKHPFNFGMRPIVWIGIILVFNSFGCAKIQKPALTVNSHSTHNSSDNNVVVKVGKYNIKAPRGYKVYKTPSATMQIIEFDNKIKSSTAQLTITHFKRLPGWPLLKKPSDLLKGSLILSRNALKHFYKSQKKDTYTHPGIIWRIVSKQPEWIFSNPGYSAKYIAYQPSIKIRYGEMRYLTFATQHGIYDLNLTMIGSTSRFNSELRQNSMKLWSEVISEFRIQSRNLNMVKRR